MPVCIANKCQKQTRSGTSPYCEMHYYRLRRTGTIMEKQRKYSISDSAMNRMSKDEAWVLGLIWSDGNLSCNRVSVTSKDKEIPIQFEV